MSMYRNITLCFFIIIASFFSFAQNEKTIAFQINSEQGQFIPHKPALNYLIQGKSIGLAFSIEKRKKDSISYGLTASILNSGNPEVIGLVYGLNGFTSFPLTKKENGMRLKIGIGLGYVEKIFDANTNNRNIVIGSHINTKIVFRAEKEFTLSENNHFNLGVGVCHFSNGAYQTPNLGINFLLFNMGYSYIKTTSFKERKKNHSIRIMLLTENGCTLLYSPEGLEKTLVHSERSILSSIYATELIMFKVLRIISQEELTSLTTLEFYIEPTSL